MTNDELQAHIKAIEEAHRNGEIEFSFGRNPPEWKPLPKEADVIYFNPELCKYRIKAKRLECFVALDGNCIVSCESTESGALRKVANYPNGRVVHMREVTDE